MVPARVRSPTARTTARVQGHGRLGRSPSTRQPEQRPVVSAAGAERRRRGQRLCLPGRRPDVVQPARRGPRQLEGLRPGPRQRTRRRRAATRTRCGAPGGTRRGPAWPTRAAPPRPTSTCPSTSRSRGSTRCSTSPTDCDSAHREPSTPPTASSTTCRASPPLRRSAGSPRTTARRPRRGVPRQQPLRRLPTRRTPKPPINYTGGLYAADLFLEHVIPEIEESPAFKDGGLIDVTFDEGFPPFTFTGNSFANSPTTRRTPPPPSPSDSAGENLFGRNVHTEPTGPNTPLATNAAGNQLYPGPGDNAFIDRRQRESRRRARTASWAAGATVPGARTDASHRGPDIQHDRRQRGGHHRPGPSGDRDQHPRRLRRRSGHRRRTAVPVRAQPERRASRRTGRSRWSATACPPHPAERSPR